MRNIYLVLNAVPGTELKPEEFHVIRAIMVSFYVDEPLRMGAGG